ncbi:MAG: TetR family transcriptional regulator [Selenomonadaceae bacterium]|nr:TetR family transcriptional regulator [Selenomonadaceae bacterium]
MAFVEALCRLGKRKSIEKITIKELTDKAGYCRATFYQHFEDIYALLDFVEGLVIEYECRHSFRSTPHKGSVARLYRQAQTAVEEAGNRLHCRALLQHRSQSGRFMDRTQARSAVGSSFETDRARVVRRIDQRGWLT